MSKGTGTILKRYRSLIVVVVLSGCEVANVVRGRSFGTDNPNLAGVTVISKAMLPVPQDTIWVLPGVRYVAHGRTEMFSDADGQFEVVRITPLIWELLGMDKVSTTLSAPGYRDLEVSGRHGQTLRAVLLRVRESPK